MSKNCTHSNGKCRVKRVGMAFSPYEAGMVAPKLLPSTSRSYLGYLHLGHAFDLNMALLDYEHSVRRTLNTYDRGAYSCLSTVLHHQKWLHKNPISAAHPRPRTADRLSDVKKTKKYYIFSSIYALCAIVSPSLLFLAFCFVYIRIQNFDCLPLAASCSKCLPMRPPDVPTIFIYPENLENPPYNHSSRPISSQFRSRLSFSLPAYHSSSIPAAASAAFRARCASAHQPCDSTFRGSCVSPCLSGCPGALRSSSSHGFGVRM